MPEGFDALRWTDLAGGVVLLFMMGVVGLELTPDDFRRVWRYRRTVVVGTLSQWLALPAATALFLLAFDLRPHVAAGVVLLTASPGGGVSNVFIYLARAHTALSVTLTAVTSLFAALTLPVLTAGGFELFVGDAGPIEVPVASMVGQLVVFVLLPIGAGMGIRSRNPILAARVAPRLRALVLGALVFLIGAGISFDRTGLVGDLVRALGPALVWTLGAFAIGYATAAVLRLGETDRFTLAIEFSVKNVGLAAIVALSGFDRPEFAVFPGAYVAVGYPLAAVAAFAHQRLAQRRAPA